MRLGPAVTISVSPPQQLSTVVVISSTKMTFVGLRPDTDVP